MKCINCQTEQTGQYCPECGQRASVKRITFKEGWSDFWSRVYGFDGMFPRTLKELTLRPGRVAREFIRGIRVKYYGPVGYFFLMITLFLLVLSMLDIDFSKLIIGTRKIIPITENGSAFEKEFPKLVADNLKWFAFLMIPFQAMASRYLFFRKSGFNLFENMVLNFYVMGHLYWLSIAGAIYFKMVGSAIHPFLQVGANVLFIAFGYTTFITYQSKIKSFLKGILLYILSQVFFVVFIALGIFIYVLMLSWLDPDALQMFKSTR